MGFYINPTNMDKDEWFDRNAHYSSISSFPKKSNYNKEIDGVACVLVDNGAFTALGICYSQNELEDFARNNGRRKLWAYVPRKLVEPYLHGKKIEGVDYNEPREHIESS